MDQTAMLTTVHTDNAETIKLSSLVKGEYRAGDKQGVSDYIHPYVREIHIKQVVCPLHVLELKNNLDMIESSETLKILPGNASVVADLVAACNVLGHSVRIIDDANSNQLYVTRKY